MKLSQSDKWKKIQPIYKWTFLIIILSALLTLSNKKVQGQSINECFGINGDNSTVCGGNGECINNNTCTCKYSYYGVDCQNLCDGLKNEICSGQGTCIKNNYCSCNQSYNIHPTCKYYNSGTNCRGKINTLSKDGPISKELGSFHIGYNLYVVGGHSGSTILNSVYSYNQKNKIWQEETNIVQPLMGHQCFSSGGIGYCYGGKTSGSISDQLYKYENNVWTTEGIVGPSTPLTNYAYVVDEENNNVILLGGENLNKETNKISKLNMEYSPVTWTDHGTLKDKVRDLTASTYKEYAIVFGGNSTSGPKNTFQRVNLQTFEVVEFIPNGTQITPQYGMKSIVYKNEMYILGGHLQSRTDAYKLNLETNIIIQIGTLLDTPRTSFTIIQTLPYEFFLFGGENEKVLGSLEKFNPRHCSCKLGYTGEKCEIPICKGILATDPKVCYSHGVCVDVDMCKCQGDFTQETMCGSLTNKYVFEGTLNKLNNNTYAYAPQFLNGAVVRRNNTLLYFGGSNSTDILDPATITLTQIYDGIYFYKDNMKHPLSNVVYEFNLDTQSWSHTNFSSNSDDGYQNYGKQCGQHKGKMFCFGGLDGKKIVNSLYELNIENMIWRQIKTPNNTDGRALAGHIVSNEKLYIFGGLYTTENGSSIEYVTPSLATRKAFFIDGGERKMHKNVAVLDLNTFEWSKSNIDSNIFGGVFNSVVKINESFIISYSGSYILYDVNTPNSYFVTRTSPRITGFNPQTLGFTFYNLLQENMGNNMPILYHNGILYLFKEDSIIDIPTSKLIENKEPVWRFSSIVSKKRDQFVASIFKIWADSFIFFTKENLNFNTNNLQLYYSCNIEFAGEHCEYDTCFGNSSKDLNSCSGHGECIGYNKCQCDAEYSSSADCSKFTQGSLCSLEINSVEVLSEVSPPSKYLSSMVVNKNEMYLMGGENLPNREDVWKFHPITKTWEKLEITTNRDLGGPLYGDVCEFYEDRIHCFDGNIPENARVSFDTWNFNINLNKIEFFFTHNFIGLYAHVIYKDKYYTFGGLYDDFSTLGQVIKKVTLSSLPFSFSGNNINYAEISEPKFGLSAQLYNDSIAILFGGYNRTNAFNTIEYFDFNTLTSTVIDTHGNLPEPRFLASTFLKENFLYVFGGTRGLSNGDVFDNVYKYNVENRKWSQLLVKFPEPLFGMSIGAHDNVFYFYGGRNNTHQNTNHFLKFEFSKCQCVDGWVTDSCSVPMCYNKRADDPNVCSTQGKCVEPNNCQCNETYTSEPQCSFQDAGATCDVSLQNIPSPQTVPTERNQSSTFVFENNLYLIGGINENGLNNEFWIFYTNSHTWKKVKKNERSEALPNSQSLGCGIYDNSAFCYDNELYIYRFDFQNEFWGKFLTTNSPSKSFYGFVFYKSQLLMFGGQHLNSMLSNTIESLDFTTLLWSKITTTLSEHKYGHTTSLFNAKIAVLYGGKNSSNVLSNTLEFYDIEADTIQKKYPKGVLPPPLIFGTTVIYHTTMYLVGGYGKEGALNTIFKLNLEELTWTQTRNVLDEPLYSFSSAFVNSFELYVFGGVNHEGSLKNNMSKLILRDCECRENFAGTDCSYPVCFQVSANDSNVCHGHGKCIRPNTCDCDHSYEIHPTCVFNIDRVDCALSVDVKTPSSSRPSGLSFSSSIGYDTNLYFFGGQTPHSYLSNILLYNTLSNSWSNVTLKNSDALPAFKGTSCEKYENYVYCFGGIDKLNRVYNTLYEFSFLGSSWRVQPTSNTPIGRHGATVVIWNKLFFLIGGRNEDDQSLDSIDFFDFDTYLWESSNGTLESPRSYFTATLHQSFAYIFGGFDGTNDLNTMEFYNCSTKKMEIKEYRGFIPPIRQGHQALSDGYALYLTGGSTSLRHYSDFYRFNYDTLYWDFLSPSLRDRITGISMSSIVPQTIYIFGGQNDQGVFSSNLYQLSTLNCECKNWYTDETCVSAYGPSNKESSLFTPTSKYTIFYHEQKIIKPLFLNEPVANYAYLEWVSEKVSSAGTVSLLSNNDIVFKTTPEPSVEIPPYTLDNSHHYIFTIRLRVIRTHNILSSATFTVYIEDPPVEEIKTDECTLLNNETIYQNSKYRLEYKTQSMSTFCPIHSKKVLSILLSENSAIKASLQIKSPTHSYDVHTCILQNSTDILMVNDTLLNFDSSMSESCSLQNLFFDIRTNATVSVEQIENEIQSFSKKIVENNDQCNGLVTYTNLLSYINSLPQSTSTSLKPSTFAKLFDSFYQLVSPTTCYYSFCKMEELLDIYFYFFTTFLSNFSNNRDYLISENFDDSLYKFDSWIDLLSRTLITRNVSSVHSCKRLSTSYASTIHFRANSLSRSILANTEFYSISIDLTKMDHFDDFVSWSNWTTSVNVNSSMVFIPSSSVSINISIPISWLDDGDYSDGHCFAFNVKTNLFDDTSCRFSKLPRSCICEFIIQKSPFFTSPPTAPYLVFAEATVSSPPYVFPTWLIVVISLSSGLLVFLLLCVCSLVIIILVIVKIRERKRITNDDEEPFIQTEILESVFE